MRKIIIVLLMLLIVAGCSNQNSVDEVNADEVVSNDVLEEEEKPEVIEETVEVETIQIEEIEYVYDLVQFGKYHGEELNWIILQIDGDRALLLSEKIVDFVQYNSDRNNTDWENCSIRFWLNNGFLNSAFSSTDREKIVTTTLTNNVTNEWNVNGGSDTEDKIFLLTVEDVEKLIPSSLMKKASATKYGDSAYPFGSNKNYAWLLRTPGEEGNKVAYVDRYGSIYELGGMVDDSTFGTRPAMWVKYK